MLAAASDPGFLVLHVLRLKGFADTSVVATLAQLPEVDATDLLEKAAADGLASRRDGRISGWALTVAGRVTHGELVRAEVAASGGHDAIDQAYRRFHELNTVLLTVCTDWQLRDGVLNDHGDEAYDASVIARLGAVDALVQPVCFDVGAALERFADYGPRFRHAFERVQAGDRDWFAKPMIDSYHTAWFELHEDLLVTLGIERSKESSTS